MITVILIFFSLPPWVITITFLILNYKKPTYTLSVISKCCHSPKIICHVAFPCCPFADKLTTGMRCLKV